MRTIHFTALFVIMFLAATAAGCSSSDDNPASDGDADTLIDGDSDGEQAEIDLPDADAEPDAEDEAVEYPWSDDTLVAMAFNVMCSFCSNTDGGNENWEQRVQHFGDIIARFEPDLIGLQELTYGTEAQEILDVTSGYQALFGKDLPANEVGWTDYPDATILYREERFTVVESGVYWNSETPDEAWAGGWQSGSAFWRIVAWARLKQISDGREFYFATTHFDNNPPNQDHSAVLALERFAPWAEEHPVIFVGDYNSKPDSTAYATLTQGVDDQGFHFIDTFEIAETWSSTHNQSPAPDYDPSRRIDHIFLGGSAEWGCPWWTVDQTVYGDDDFYPSDHFPIVSEITW